jgi:exodeoxyribonuclease VII small subunit
MVEIDQLMASLDQPVGELTYEQAYRQLEEIVSMLETSEYSLQVSLRLFERGQNLARYCSEQLDQAELKVKQVSGESLVEFETPE